MNEKIKTARKQLGQFFQTRRRQMGRTQLELADHLGTKSGTIKGIETGRYAYDIDTLFRVCEALDIKPVFAPLEETRVPGSPKGKFLFAPDGDQLHILHRQYPACLIQVIQTTPVTFRVVDLYDKIEESELAVHPFLEEAKAFWKEYINNQDQN